MKEGEKRTRKKRRRRKRSALKDERVEIKKEKKEGEGPTNKKKSVVNNINFNNAAHLGVRRFSMNIAIDTRWTFMPEFLVQTVTYG